MKRSDFIKLMSSTMISLGMKNNLGERLDAKPQKKVLIIGGGLSGLSSGYELMKLGHEATVLEASDRLGGHVLSLYQPFADGLYADIGGDHFVNTGYKIFQEYMKELDLDPIAHSIRDSPMHRYKGEWFNSEVWVKPDNLAQRGYNKKEIAYIKGNSIDDVPLLYYGPYLNKIKDQYKPLNVGLNYLEDISLSNFLKKKGASSKVASGGSNISALQAIWEAAIMKIRAIPFHHTKLGRIKGGNENLIYALQKKLEDSNSIRIRKKSKVISVQQNSKSVNIKYRHAGQVKKEAADYIIFCVPFPKLNDINIEPRLSDAKQKIIDSVSYTVSTRVVIQFSSRFWEKENISPNLHFGTKHLRSLWSTAEEVDTKKGLLAGYAAANSTEDKVRSVIENLYPGKTKPNVEKVYIKKWFRDKWAPYCERRAFPVGELSEYWPEIMRPEGRIHFASAATDNLTWGMQSATRSARRVANSIHMIN